MKTERKGVASLDHYDVWSSAKIELRRLPRGNYIDVLIRLYLSRSIFITFRRNTLYYYYVMSCFVEWSGDRLHRGGFWKKCTSAQTEMANSTRGRLLLAAITASQSVRNRFQLLPRRVILQPYYSRPLIIYAYQP